MKQKIKKTVKYILITICICSLYLIMGALLPYCYHKTVSADFIRNFDVKSFYDYDNICVDRAGLLEDPDEALYERIRCLSQAKERIVISSFAFKNDTVCKELFSVILHAADEGVKVQILADGTTGFLDMSDSSLYKLLGSHKNIQIKYYNPINLLTPWTLNARMHDKYILVDDKYLILGGRNTSSYFLGSGNLKSLSYDRDVLIYNTAASTDRTNESVITDVYTYFESVWNYKESEKKLTKVSSSDKKAVKKIRSELEEIYQDLTKNHAELFEDYDMVAHTVGTHKVSLIHNPIEANNKQPLIWYQLNELMKSAEYRVYIHSPYIVLDKNMYKDLKNSSKTLEQFDLLINSIAVGDNIMASTDYYENKPDVLKTGVTVHEFQGEHSMHDKSVLIDNDLSIIGSFNFDMRSAYLDTETMLVIHSESFNNMLYDAIKDMEDQSITIDENGNDIDNGTVEKKAIPTKKDRLFKSAHKLFQLIRNLL